MPLNLKFVVVISLKRCSLITHEERGCMSKIPYTSAIRSLMYMMICTRPDIVYVVSVVSRYQSSPDKSLDHNEAYFELLAKD